MTSASKPVVLVDSVLPGLPAVRIDDRRGSAIAMALALRSKPSKVLVLSFLIEEEERQRILAQKRPRLGHVCLERTAGYAMAARDAGFR